MFRFIGVSLIALTVAGCAPRSAQPVITDDAARREAELQAKMAFDNEVEMTARLARVHWPIATNNKELCGENVSAKTGITALSPKTVSKNYKSILTQTYGLSSDDETVIVGLVAAAPAAQSGMKVGDRVVGLNGDKMSWTDIVKRFNQEKTEQRVTFNLTRDGKSIDIELTPSISCKYPTRIQSNTTVNAFADGESIVVYTGMMKFVESDEELALILGHEMAHNAMGHLEAKRGNELAGVLAGAVLSALTGVDVTNSFANAGADAFSQEFEGEADYVGTYFVARAGYDISNAPMLWRRMGVANPSAIHLKGSTHPSTAKRFMAIDETIKEIEQKRDAGKPLTPNMKPAEEA